MCDIEQFACAGEIAVDSETDEDLVARVQAIYAVSLHLHAKRRIRIANAAIGLTAVIAVFYTRSLWWAVGAFVATAATQRFILNSCVRFVTSKTGIPPDMQIYFLQRYKVDPDFKQQVDRGR